MANYTRRAANDVSQFLREGGLNSVRADESHDDYPLPDADLDLFMNREFIDFDTGLSTNFKADSPTAPKPGESVTATATATTVPDFGGLDFMSTAGDFNFGDFNNQYASPISTAFPEGLQPLQPSAHNVYPPVPHSHSFGHHAVGQPKTGEKRRATDPPQTSAHSRALSIEEASRVAAEEDKRRRNTAASARFRVKKKQREAALEKSAKEMNDKVSALESKISQLETENQWLKKLILEKNDGTTSSKSDLTKIVNSKGAANDEITVKEVGSKKEDKSS